jgi:hypothetical protein
MNHRNKTWQLRLALLASLLPILASAAIAATPAGSSAPATGSESLGGKLLEDLNPSRFPPPSPSPAVEPRPAVAAPPLESYQKRITPDFSDPIPGEDLGARSGSAALERIERQMGAAQSLLREAQAPDRAGLVQQQVVADLDALIEQLSKQCQGGASQSSKPSSSPSQRSQANGAKPAAKPGHGTAPARDSTTRIGHNYPGAAGAGDREQLLKDFWGHLPPHAREQMLQSNSDEFLPQYELDIERYYRRLSEEQSPASDAR